MRSSCGSSPCNVICAPRKVFARSSARTCALARHQSSRPPPAGPVRWFIQVIVLRVLTIYQTTMRSGETSELVTNLRSYNKDNDCKNARQDKTCCSLSCQPNCPYEPSVRASRCSLSSLSPALLIVEGLERLISFLCLFSSGLANLARRAVCPSPTRGSTSHAGSHACIAVTQNCQARLCSISVR